jgi:hypothetical protein
MPVSLNRYELQNSFIHNWLVAGPVTEALPQPFADPAEWMRRQYSQDPQIIGKPVERGPLTEGLFKVGNVEGAWNYFRCKEDHFVDLSMISPKPEFLRAWAYAQVTSPAAQTAVFVLKSFGPADVWVNGGLVYHAGDAQKEVFNADLVEGENEVMLRLMGVAAPACRLAAALSVEAAGLGVGIPTLIPSIGRRNEIETVAEQIYFDRDVYSSEDRIILSWPDGPEKSSYNDVRLQTPAGRIYAQSEDVGTPNQQLHIATGAGLNEGPYHAFIMPRAWEYYDSQIRISKTIGIWNMGRNRFSAFPYATLEERSREALVNAAAREGGVFPAIAKIALGTWNDSEEKDFSTEIEKVSRHPYGSEVALLGLVGLAARFGSRPDFPQAVKKLIKDCAMHFPFGPGEPGGNALDFNAESRQIIFHAAEILAGQLYPESVFHANGLTGKQLRRRGEAAALAWMQAHGRMGFAGWDSPVVYADTIIALSHLIDLAKLEAVWELGSVLMDKLLYSIALNSHKGLFGSTQGSASASLLKSGLVEPTSGITRVLWGMGVFNRHIEGAVSMACMTNYELPLVIAEIAAGLPEELWSREQQVSEGRVVNKVTYRSPDAMLCSAQDYKPGQPGEREHIWQATLGPQSVVFVNHPGSSSENEAYAPNFWLGNAVLPRVAQWKDVLIALYNLPEDDWMGYTHAYFPTRDFDDYVLRGNTAFARKGSTYLALTASQGVEMVTLGPSAYRELRSVGKQVVWICQMGRAAVDGEFSDFQEKILALPVVIERLEVDCTTLRGENLSFGWESPFLRNGEIQALDGYKHIENPYTTADLPCMGMEIRTNDYLLRLDFSDLDR